MNGLSLFIAVLLVLGITVDGGGTFDEVSTRVKISAYAFGLVAFAVATICAIF